MAETADLDRPEESHADEDDQDGQDPKKQRITEPDSMSRGEQIKRRAVRNQQKSCLFLSERSKIKLYEFSQYNRILLVIPPSRSDNEESSIVHTLNCSIEDADKEILRVYKNIEKYYYGLISVKEWTKTTISYKLHELVPFSIALCREMVVGMSIKEKLGVRSAVLRDGSLHIVFANCIRIVTNKYANNITQFIIVESFPF